MFATIDLWELPDSRLTATLSKKLEDNFYSRCPPEKRPEVHRPPVSPSASPKEEAESKSITPSPTVEGKEKPGGKETPQTKKWSWLQLKPKIFKTDSAGNVKYDSSLLKALHRTFFIRWWTAGLIDLIASAFLCLSKLHFSDNFFPQIPFKRHHRWLPKSYLRGSQMHIYTTASRTSRRQPESSSNHEALDMASGWHLHCLLCKVCRCILRRHTADDFGAETASLVCIALVNCLSRCKLITGPR